MSAALIDRLDTAIALTDDSQFLESVAWLDPRYEQVDFTAHPPPLSWLAAVFHFYLSTVDEGIANYLMRDGDLDTALTLESCWRMELGRAFEYLTAAVALCPGGKAPVRDVDRARIVQRLETKARDRGMESPFTLLDRQFADVMPSLAAGIRRWIVEHRDEVNGMLRRIGPPVQPPPTEIEVLERALVTIEQAVSNFHAKRQHQLDVLRPAAEARGLLPWRATSVDERFVAFFDAAARFGHSEWLRVAERKLATPRKFTAANRSASRTLDLLPSVERIQRAGLVPGTEFREWLAEHWAVRAPAVAVARAMPVQAMVHDKPIGLMAAANDAIIAVSICLVIHDWMMLTPDGIKAARVLYGVFDGLAPCPELPPAAPRKRRPTS